MRIIDTRMSKKLMNALLRQKYIHLEELLILEDYEIYDFRGIGKKYFSEIKKILIDLEKSLGRPQLDRGIVCKYVRRMNYFLETDNRLTLDHVIKDLTEYVYGCSSLTREEL